MNQWQAFKVLWLSAMAMIAAGIDRAGTGVQTVVWTTAIEARFGNSFRTRRLTLAAASARCRAYNQLTQHGGVEFMETCPPSGKSRDILSNPWMTFAVFWLPGMAIIAAGIDRVGTGLRTIVWTAALSVMGAGCAVNAARCGRLHCYFTAPFFFLMAAVSLLYGLGVVPLGRQGWNLLAVAVILGVIVLTCLPEMIFGQYRQARTPGGEHS